MKKNVLRMIPNKKLVYEENYSIDQVVFNSQFTPKHKRPHQPFTHQTIPHINYLKQITLNLKRHNAIAEKDINALILRILIYKKKSHLYAYYNDVIISSSDINVLRRYYSITEGVDRLPKFSKYYKHYLTLLIKPTMTSQLYNTIIHNSSNQKAQLYWFKAYGSKSRENTLSNNNNTEGNGNGNEIQNAIFDSETKESIDHFSTTITCESNEQLRYPEEMLRKIIERQFINSNSGIPMQYDKTITLSETLLNLNRSGGFLNEESIITLMNNFKKSNTNTGNSNNSNVSAITRRPNHFMTTSTGGVKYDYMVRTKKSLLKTSSLLTENNNNNNDNNKEKATTTAPSKKVSINYRTLKPKLMNNPLLKSDTGSQLRMSKPKYYTINNTNANTHTNVNSNANINPNEVNTISHNHNRTFYTSRYKQRRLSGIDSNKTEIPSDTNKTNTHKQQTPNELLFSADKVEIPKGRKPYISRSKSPLKSIQKPKQFINTNTNANSKTNTNTNANSNTNPLFSSHQIMSHNIIQGCYKDIYAKRREHFLHNKYYY